MRRIVHWLEFSFSGGLTVFICVMAATAVVLIVRFA